MERAITTKDDGKRYARAALAKKLNVTVWYVRGMVAAGFPMPGRTSTVAAANQWLEEHPNFSPTLAILERRKKQQEERELESSVAAPRGRQLSGAHKSGELLSTHG